MNSNLEPDEASHILNKLAMPADAFACHMVDKAVGNVRNQDRRLSEPL
jgi:putative SOS response-associated peptidase YedK